MKVLNGCFMFVYNVGITWVRLWSEVVLPDMLVSDWSRHSCQLPSILWSSWGPMTTIEDEEFFFFLGDLWDHVLP